MADRLDAYTALHELLRRLFVAASGVVDTNFFRPSGQRAPAGPGDQPYATVLLYATQLEGYDLRRWFATDSRLAEVTPVALTTDLAEVLESLERVTASVQFWRDGHVDAAGRPSWGLQAVSRAASLVKRLELSPVIELMNAYGLAYVTASQVRDLSAEADGSWEGRAQVDLTFYFSDSEVAALNMFKTASLHLKLQQPDGHISEVTA